MGIFSANGGGELPLWGRYWYPCHGHVIQPSTNLPSPSGPSLGGQTVALDDCWRYATVDLANSTKTSADWTVVAAWARTNDGQLVLLDRLRARIGERDHFQHVRPLVERWKLDTVFVEASQFGTTLVREATQAGIPISALEAESDKLTRALPASAWCSGGRVWLPAGAWWTDGPQGWVSEHAAFPNAAHDDQVDVMSYAVRVAVTRWAPTTRTPAHAAPVQRGVEDDAFGGGPAVDFSTMPM